MRYGGGTAWSDYNRLQIWKTRRDCRKKSPKNPSKISPFFSPFFSADHNFVQSHQDTLSQNSTEACRTPARQAENARSPTPPPTTPFLAGSLFLNFSAFFSIMSTGSVSIILREVTEAHLLELMDLTCSICMNGFGLRQDVSLLECQHVFHYDCLDAWLCSVP